MALTAVAAGVMTAEVIIERCSAAVYNLAYCTLGRFLHRYGRTEPSRARRAV